MKRAGSIPSVFFAGLCMLLLFASCSSGTTAQTLQADETGATIITFDAETASVSGEGAVVRGMDVQIVRGGTYTVRGTSAGGRIVVDTESKDVTLVLDGVQIASAKRGAIYAQSAGTTTIYVKEGTVNSLSDSEGDEDGADACICANGDLILAGDGNLTVNGAGKGVEAGRNITINGGNCTFECADDAVHANGSVMIRRGRLIAVSGDDAIHADYKVTVEDGEISLTAHEGIEGTLIALNGGKISVKARDDGINAARKTKGVTPIVNISGGELEIEMEPGDSDGIDSNGDLIINGGTVRVTAQVPFDFDGKGELNGGAVFVGGERVTDLADPFGERAASPEKS